MYSSIQTKTADEIIDHMTSKNDIIKPIEVYDILSKFKVKEKMNIFRENFKLGIERMGEDPSPAKTVSMYTEAAERAKEAIVAAENSLNDINKRLAEENEKMEHNEKDQDENTKEINDRVIKDQQDTETQNNMTNAITAVQINLDSIEKELAETEKRLKESEEDEKKLQDVYNQKVADVEAVKLLIGYYENREKFMSDISNTFSASGQQQYQFPTATIGNMNDIFKTMQSIVNNNNEAMKKVENNIKEAGKIPTGDGDDKNAVESYNGALNDCSGAVDENKKMNEKNAEVLHNLRQRQEKINNISNAIKYAKDCRQKIYNAKNEYRGYDEWVHEWINEWKWCKDRWWCGQAAYDSDEEKLYNRWNGENIRQGLRAAFEFYESNTYKDFKNELAEQGGTRNWRIDELNNSERESFTLWDGGKKEVINFNGAGQGWGRGNQAYAKDRVHWILDGMETRISKFITYMGDYKYDVTKYLGTGVQNFENNLAIISSKLKTVAKGSSDQIKLLELRLSQLRLQRDELLNIVETKLAEVNALMFENAKIRKNINNLKASIEKDKEDIRNYTKQLAEIELEKGRLKNEMDQLTITLTKLKHEAEILRKNILNIETAKATILEELEQLRKELSEAEEGERARIQQLINEKETLLQQQQYEHDKYKADLEKVLSDIEETQKKYDQASSRYKELEEQKKQIQAQMKRLEEDIANKAAAMYQYADDLEYNIKTMRENLNSIGGHIEEIQEITRKIVETEQQLEEAKALNKKYKITTWTLASAGVVIIIISLIFIVYGSVTKLQMEEEEMNRTMAGLPPQPVNKSSARYKIIFGAIGAILGSGSLITGIIMYKKFLKSDTEIENTITDIQNDAPIGDYTK